MGIGVFWGGNGVLKMLGWKWGDGYIYIFIYVYI